MTGNRKKASKRAERRVRESQAVQLVTVDRDYHVRVPGQDVHVLTRGQAHGSIEGPRGLNTYPRELRDQDAQEKRRAGKRGARR